MPRGHGSVTDGGRRSAARERARRVRTVEGARMDAAGRHYDDAGVYAMPSMHQIYTLDPSMNVIEINQKV